MKKSLLILFLLFGGISSYSLLAQSHNRMLGDPIDGSTDFRNFKNTFFFADKLASFDPATGKGKINWKRSTLYTRQAFEVNTIFPQDMKMLDFPGAAYEQNPELSFHIDFVSPRTVRIRFLTTPVVPKPFDSPMLVGKLKKDNSWIYTRIPNGHLYSSTCARLLIEKNLFRIILIDASGKRLTETWRWADNDSSQVKVLPFSFIKKGIDNSREINPVFSLLPNEKIFGCGESFTKLDKRGQIVNLFVTDPQGSETPAMDKPIPYASGRSGWYEHNLYPFRYNQAVAEITKQITGDNIICARSAWAGSQRYPLHWGGDTANKDIAMESELRGGLSFGLSGFLFRSHDIGGFVQSSPENLFRRWLPFGFLSSHSRAHGAPPKEPWLYNSGFVKAFRESAEMKYKLMPYVYAQAKQCTETGLPMVGALFIEYLDDPGAWNIKDANLFGSDIYVAPLMENTVGRDVYLSGNQNWVDYQTGKNYPHGWNHIEAGEIPCIILVRNGAVIHSGALAQCTSDIDWHKIKLKVYGYAAKAEGHLCLPTDNQLIKLELTKKKNRID